MIGKRLTYKEYQLSHGTMHGHEILMFYVEHAYAGESYSMGVLILVVLQILSSCAQEPQRRF